GGQKPTPDIQPSTFSKLILHPSFHRTIDEINKCNIQIPAVPSEENFDFQRYSYPDSGRLVSTVETAKKYVLDAKDGDTFSKSGVPITAYDESINKFQALEGTAFLMSHSQVIHGDGDYLSSNLVTLYFYTRSKAYSEGNVFIRYSQDPESDSKKDYMNDRTKFIVENSLKNSIVLIDGPLIGGQGSSYTIRLNNELLKKDAIPLFFVKNSTSNLVTNNTNELMEKYNSDMDWSFKTLRVGERSCFFKYVDEYNPTNAKVFCYIKPLDLSPQRVELHVSTYDKYTGLINRLMNLVYYLILVQGNVKNPQVRTIAIAEKFARASLRLADLNKLMTNLKITPTINQSRFGWG
ncbi:MAG: DNA double-strand break repair nuclease NurA, partial [Thaumarchaeota archaeon]|nr:DNA double-strand break repair nuclease NurA [Nitrososphaerota archaeon]